jgi:hypothetical protein
MLKWQFMNGSQDEQNWPSKHFLTVNISANDYDTSFCFDITAHKPLALNKSQSLPIATFFKKVLTCVLSSTAVTRIVLCPAYHRKGYPRVPFQRHSVPARAFANPVICSVLAVIQLCAINGKTTSESST